jgi:alpha-beta hydrolase superfamily lysophospholipase
VTDTTQAPFVLRDGLNLALYDWPLPMRWRPRGVVLIVHGLGEHAWRYDPLAQRLNEWGFAVRAYDQRGHGDSAGPHGAIPYDEALLDDLDELVEDTRHHIATPWSCPLILLGHSMGGLVASAYVQRSLGQARPPVDALVLSSPALDPGLGWVQRQLLALRLDASKISHSAEVVQAYQRDRLVHNRITARLAHFIQTRGPRVLASAAQWNLPTLLMYAGDDRLVDPQGSRRFASAAPSRFVHARCFDGLYHEIFNEADTTPVVQTLHAWLDRLVPAQR